VRRESAAQPGPETAARSLALLLHAAGGPVRDLTELSTRIYQHLYQCNLLPPNNPQLRPYQQNMTTLIAERVRHVLGLVEAAHGGGGGGGAAAARARAVWQAERRSFSFLAPGAGKSFTIALSIVLFPHALTGAPPPSSGLRPTAARHLIVFPFRANVAELLEEGLAIEGRPCRACRDAGIEADASACDGCRDELHRAAEASSLCLRLGMRRSHVLELARRVYVLPPGFNPRDNVQHRRGFEESMIVLATEDKVVLAVEAGFITAGDIRALWFDEADYGRG